MISSLTILALQAAGSESGDCMDEALCCVSTCVRYAENIVILKKIE